jgi:cytochrome c biogenesis factor
VTLLLIALLWLVDVIARRKRMDVAAPVFASAAFSLTNSALLTSLLSHGIIAALVAIALLPDRREAPAISWQMPGRIRAWAARPSGPHKPADP